LGYVGILAAAAVLAAILLQRPRSVEDDPAPMQVFQTGAGEEETVWFEDRTIVHLGPLTRLEATHHPDRPQLRLEGTAFFAVPEQDGRRLIVRTDGGEITVLATRFAVQAASGNLELLVLEGRVSLSASEEQVEVAESERSVVTGGTIDEIVVLDDPLAYLGWMGRTVIFQATSLARAATEIEHRYGVDIEIENPALRNRMITTIFDDRPIEEVMAIVCAVEGAQCETGPDRKASLGSPRPLHPDWRGPAPHGRVWRSVGWPAEDESGGRVQHRICRRDLPPY